jgi:hypothetical protein
MSSFAGGMHQSLFHVLIAEGNFGDWLVLGAFLEEFVCA